MDEYLGDDLDAIIDALEEDESAFQHFLNEEVEEVHTCVFNSLYLVTFT